MKLSLEASMILDAFDTRSSAIFLLMANVASAQGEGLLQAIMDLQTIAGPTAAIQDEDVDWALLEGVGRVFSPEERHAWGRLFALAVIEEDPQFLAAVQALLRRRMAN